MVHRYRRTVRVEELLKEEIARVVRLEVKDPRVGFATIMHVDVTPDLRHAKVFVSVMGDEEEKQASVEALQRASGFIRGRVGREVTLKRLPELHFEIDRTLERAARIEELLDRARPEEEGSGGTDDGEEGGGA
jgi:ribosome-binding factor A